MRSAVPTLLVLAALARPVTVHAQQSAGSSGEQTLRELVRAMNASDRPALRRLIDEQFAKDGPNVAPTEQRVERFTGIHARFGDFAIKSIDASKPREVEALAQSTRTEAWVSVALVYDDAGPARILGVRFAPGKDPDAPARRPSDAELSRHDTVSELRSATGVSPTTEFRRPATLCRDRLDRSLVASMAAGGLDDTWSPSGLARLVLSSGR